MSIAEFYIDNGIDPSDPNHMDDFLDRMRYENGFESDSSEEISHENQGYHFSGLVIAENTFRNDDSHHRNHNLVLDRSALDQMARLHGYQILDTSSSTSPMASYKLQAVRLNFWLTTGTVGSYLEHPRQGKTQLFRRDVSLTEAGQIFANPRLHSGRGYHTKGGGGSRGPCRYGNRCYRVDCWFDH